MVDIKNVYNSLKNMLGSFGDTANIEAQVLMNHFCGVSLSDIVFGEKKLNETDVNRAKTGAKLRAAGYPLQYILGEWEFFGRKFYVGEGVLVPRQDTEILVEVCLEYLKTHECESVADLCSGSGCIAVTLAKEADIKQVVAIEKSQKATEYLNRNIKHNRANVSVVCDDVLSPTKLLHELDLLVSNPPYLTQMDMELLQKEVRFEPKIALYGGEDGSAFYYGIVQNYKECINKGGMIAFEIGQGQHNIVKNILSENGFKDICLYKDLCGIIRVVTGIKE